jgi:glutamate 5-kinase
MSGDGVQGSDSGVVVAKIGTSSITDHHGLIDEAAVAAFCEGLAKLRAEGRRVVAVSSGAIAAGLPALDLGGDRRPRDPVTLQAVAAIGQARLMAVYERELAHHGLIAGQVLLTPLDFMVRDQYLQARGTLDRLLELGVVPVVNENDATADDEIRFGDNDRLAALVAHLVRADALVLLTDTAGLYTADPRFDETATLIEEIRAGDELLDAAVGGSGTDRGSGGMASKLAAARIAAWSGVRAVIASAGRPDVLAHAVHGEPGVGTVVHPRSGRLSARKLWIAFAVRSAGIVTVDAGARDALVAGGRSLLPAGVVSATGSFNEGAAVEIAGPDGTVFAKALVAVSDRTLADIAGRHTSELPPEVPHEVIHRDDLVVLPDQP